MVVDLALFGKKEDEKKSQGVPVDRVLNLRKQGMTNNQIIQSLQGEGYSSSQVFDALSQADIKGNAPEQPSGPQPQAQNQNSAQPTPESPGMPPPPGMGMPPPPGQNVQQPSQQESQEVSEQVESLVESVVEEKWEELIKGVEKIAEWKQDADRRLVRIEEDIKNLKKNFDDLHKGVLGKISEYDRGVREVGSSIDAMEKVFKKSLPEFTKNINELSRITRSAKSKKKKKKQ